MAAAPSVFSTMHAAVPLAFSGQAVLGTAAKPSADNPALAAVAVPSSSSPWANGSGRRAGAVARAYSNGAGAATACEELRAAAAEGLPTVARPSGAAARIGSQQRQQTAWQPLEPQHDQHTPWRQQQQRRRRRRRRRQCGAGSSPNKTEQASVSPVDDVDDSYPASLELPRESSSTASSSWTEVQQQEEQQQKQQVQRGEERGSSRQESSLTVPERTAAAATVRDAITGAVRALEDTPLERVRTTALVAGSGLAVVALASSLLGSLDGLPLVPEAMQVVGVIYLGFVVREQLMKEKAEFAPSPLPWLSRVLTGETTHNLTQDDTPQSSAPVTASSAAPARTVAPAAKMSAASAPATAAPAPAPAPAPAASTQAVAAQAELVLSDLPEALEEKVSARLRELAEQRDAAVAQLNQMRRAEADVGRVVAEKEALEAVAAQLAEERDTAMAEVSALKGAVNAMTERMKSIEAMLAEEVQRLQEQNTALETVALQLADERDAAIKQAAEVKEAFAVQRAEDKRVVEMLAQQLIAERNEAVRETQELKAVVERLLAGQGQAALEGAGADRHGRAGGGGTVMSGLTPQMEVFMRSRVAAVRSQFIDMTKPYEEQAVAADSFVSHLVEEYGAPRKWTQAYVRQLLRNAQHQPSALSPPTDASEHRQE